MYSPELPNKQPKCIAVDFLALDYISMKLSCFITLQLSTMILLPCAVIPKICCRRSVNGVNTLKYTLTIGECDDLTYYQKEK